MELIRFENVALGYDKQIILQQVNFSIKKDRITVFLGPNGAGKSTLFSSVNGLIKQFSGNIYIQGKEHLSVRQRAQQIAYVPQMSQVGFGYKVFHMILWGRAPYINYMPGKTDEEIAHSAMQRLEITHLAEKQFDHLSGGERQLVLIARALVQQTPIILMDEPTTFLDLANQVKILRLICDINKKEQITFGITLHDPNHALFLADDVVLVHNKTVRFGNAKDLLTPNTIKEVFGVNVTLEKEQFHIMY